MNLAITKNKRMNLNTHYSWYSKPIIFRF